MLQTTLFELKHVVRARAPEREKWPAVVGVAAPSPAGACGAWIR